MSAAPTLERATAVEPLPRPVEAAASRLYESHARLVLTYCLRRLRNREDAEDAAQTTFFYALRALRRGVVPEVESAWLLTIARNVCHERWNAARRRGDVEATHDPQVLEEIAPAVESANGDAASLRAGLASLPEQQRRALVLREWHGLAYREIAVELGVSQAATEALLFRARRSLAAVLGGENGNGKRVRALDLASLFAGLKPLLGGASAVKLGALAAAAATAIAVAGATAPHFLSDAKAPAPWAATPSVAAGSVQAEQIRPRFTAALEAKIARSQAPDPRPGADADRRAGGKAGPTGAGEPSGSTTDPGSSTDPISDTTSALTDSVDQTVEDTIGTVEDAVSTVPALPDASDILPSTEAPIVEVPDVSLP